MNNTFDMFINFYENPIITLKWKSSIYHWGRALMINFTKLKRNFETLMHLFWESINSFSNFIYDTLSSLSHQNVTWFRLDTSENNCWIGVKQYSLVHCIFVRDFSFSISRHILARANMGIDFVSGQYGCLFSRCRKYVINSLIHIQ
jgi:hypothetical protein